jgi:hypothetical protein
MSHSHNGFIPRFPPDPNRPPVQESVFRVGNPDFVEDVIESGKRVLRWQSSPEDWQLGDLAGWNSAFFRPGTEVEGHVHIEIPRNVSTAGSVLSGTEAWQGEKDDVIDFITGYQKKVRAQFNALDTSVTLDTVAVFTVLEISKDRLMFIVPPHHLSRDSAEIKQWASKLVDDLDRILVKEPKRQELIERFHAALRTNGEYTK